PTVPGPYVFVVQVADSASLTATQSFSVSIVPQQLTILTASLPSGTVGASYSQSLAANGGTPPYNWSVTSGSLPSGLSLASTGAIAGTPTVAGTQTFTVHVGDAGLLNATQTLSLAITQPICTYALYPGGQVFPFTGGSGSITVTAGAGCTWTVSGAPTWVTIVSGASGSGNGAVNYVVSANGTNGGLNATPIIAGLPFTIEEQTASPLPFVGSMPHIAAQENWTTTFTLVNKSAISATARLSLYGDPSGTLTLPMAFPQQPLAPTPLLAASLDRALSGNASLITETAGPQMPPVEVGSAQLAATGAIDGFAIFHLIPSAQEAVVPMETRNANSYLLAYDNTGDVVLGVAVHNVSAQAGSVGIVIRDDAGTQIGSGVIPIMGNGHTSFVLSTQYPATSNKRGTIEFDTPAGGQISVLGIRTTPLGTTTTLTTIPALANVGTSGGSIAHLATGNGWQTTFVLVNTGTTAAQANLSFFADNGLPLPLPLGATTAPSVNQLIPAGGSLIVQSAAPLSDPTPTTGSAQLATTGNVSGFVIFRYNPNGQEAVVPLESRNASGYIVAFDNMAGTATGIAINSVSSQAVNVPVVIRDDAGNQLATDTLNLAANGHLAFTLGTDKYPATANIRGTIEFDTPPGAQIGALGVRIPVAHTFTTLPALAK
ncbi:MAG: putative Ig domain-containing protein, partial [Acidobacteriota bacterium]|nr:putative Ig domain-containing protein [Acidobacteriota bacterium]